MVLFTIIGPCGVKLINVSYILHACAKEENNIQNKVIVLVAWLPAFWRLRVVKKQWAGKNAVVSWKKNIVKKSHET